ncbi:sporulation protein [Pseudoalteromonas denitrificans]|uniref:Sporulation-control protein n=1 Tax=Pseudoalteromonas denitrificans DSM 6059 TaxID=1123010 RepID=A0A1I1S400_9GAMM|nr:sporulation protein [Pseudoalteromonas denitrificans]SFD41209.1 sporulation-control protein [Pseudoalteromonas denitrificans DSM 6059]
MSIFNKVLSSVGIGAAKVDTVLEYSEVEPGGEISGVVKIVGGKVEQNINKIDLDVICNYTVEVEREDSDGNEETVTKVKKYKLTSYKIKEAFTIQPKEKIDIPFSFELSQDAPLSVGQSKTWIDTNLDIERALDKSDKDYLHVSANDLQQAVIDALEELGFRLYEADCEGIESASFSRLPFVQELEFKTISGDFHGKFDEVEVVFFARGEQLEVVFEIDRKSKGLMGFFKEAMDLDESNARLVVTEDDIDDLEDSIYEILENNM